MFPNYKKISFFNPKLVPDGWEDLGEMSKMSYVRKGKAFYTWKACKICNDRAMVGREKGKFFYFCKRCSIKIK
jgi:hypothetical protein